MSGKLEDCVKTTTSGAEYDTLRDASKKQPFTRVTLALSKPKLTEVCVYLFRDHEGLKTIMHTKGNSISFRGWSKGSSRVGTEEQHANILSKPLQSKKVVVVQWARSTNTFDA